MEQEVRLHIRSYLQKSVKTFREAELLNKHSFYEAAISPLYYACFYAVHALLMQYGIRTKSHKGIKQMFSLHFIKSGIISIELGDFYNTLLDLRQLMDYDDHADFSEEMAEEMMPKAKVFMDAVQKLITEE